MEAGIEQASRFQPGARTSMDLLDAELVQYSSPDGKCLHCGSKVAYLEH